MKQILTILSLFFSAISFGQDSVKNVAQIDIDGYINSTIGKQFGHFKIKTSNMTLFSNSQLNGKIVFVNFCLKVVPRVFQN